MNLSTNLNINLKNCHEYLISLVASRNKKKFDLMYFKTLVSTSALDTDDFSLMVECCVLLLELLDVNRKQFQLSCDIAYTFYLLSFSKLKEISFTNLLVPETFFEFFPKIIFTNIAKQLKRHSPILVAGSLRYLISINHEFDRNLEFVVRMKMYIYELLKKVDEFNALLFIADYFLSVIDSPNISADQLEIVTCTIMSVVMNYWNFHIAEVRNRVKKLFYKCLKICYNDSLKIKNSPLVVAVNLKLFKAFARDILWSVPYKFFAYLVGLEFIAEIHSISNFLMSIRADLREGFIRSLQNKRVIGIEIDLFVYCTEKLSYEEWNVIFDPIIDAALHSNNMIMANNFSRYWLPVILRNFPEFSLKIWHQIPTGDSTQRTAPHSRILFALLKICQKQKIHLPVTEDKEQYLKFLETCFVDDENTRGELFFLLCNLDDQSMVISESEFRLILDFLDYNAHSCSAVLRQQVFSSFARMILRLICSSVRILKLDSSSSTPTLKPMLSFLVDFNSFVVDSLQPGSSYQRKITSLALYKIFMSYAVSNCGENIRHNNLKNTEIFISFAQNQGAWHFTDTHQFEALFRCLMDPCSELQNVSFSLLRTYFDLTHVENKSSLFHGAMTLLKNNHFYKRQSGVAAVLSLICLAYNSNNNSEQELSSEKSAHHLFIDMFLEILKNQTKLLKDDILNAALFDPLNATIKILTFLVTDNHSPEYIKTTREQLETLVELLEEIVPLLLKALFVDEFKDYASSFEESDQALHNIIGVSKVVSHLDIQETKEDEFQLKPLYQILLNFLWISLKTCCECESQLIVKRMDLLDQHLVTRCSNAIIKKLKLCRHKGVIEAAAVSLSNVVEKLTTVNICEDWLNSVLSDVIYLIEFKSSDTISRKSGGLSLLVQNLVGSDKREEKPLLVKCCAEFRRILNVDFDVLHSNLSQELPQTHALHLLRVLVADARNAYGLYEYFEEIAIICIRALKACMWVVRNAALQLFGAILPKIVGQKNSQNDFGVSRSFEEVFTTMPSLLDHILLEFERGIIQDSYKLTSHSNLVPLLVLLSNIQVCSVNIMESSLREKLFHMRDYIRGLISSDIYFVRKFAGKAMVSLHSRNEISVFNEMKHGILEKLLTKNRNENLLHGQLLTLKQVFTVHSQITNFERNFRTSYAVYGEVSRLNVSLMSETLLYDLNIKSRKNFGSKAILNRITSVFNLLPVQRYKSMGYDEWGLVLQRSSVVDSSFALSLFKNSLSSTNNLLIENSMRALYPWIISECSQDTFSMLCNLMVTLLHTPECRNQVSVLKLVFEIIVHIPDYLKMIDDNFISRNFDLLYNLNLYHYQAMNIRVLSIMISIIRFHRIDSVLLKIFTILDVTIFNRDARVNAAEAMLLLCDWIIFQDIHKEIFWLILVNLVLDEEDDIRSIACKCINNAFKLSKQYRCPDEALNDLFNPSLMLRFFPLELFIHILENMLFSNLPDLKSSSVREHLQKEIIYVNEEISNPFDQGTKNIFKGEIRIIELAGKGLKILIKNYDGKQFVKKLRSENIESIVNICEMINQNKYLISNFGYEIGLRSYYILEICKLLNNCGVYECCDAFRQIFHVN